MNIDARRSIIFIEPMLNGRFTFPRRHRFGTTVDEVAQFRLHSRREPVAHLHHDGLLDRQTHVRWQVPARQERGQQLVRALFEATHFRITGRLQGRHAGHAPGESRRRLGRRRGDHRQRPQHWIVGLGRTASPNELGVSATVPARPRNERRGQPIRQRRCGSCRCAWPRTAPRRRAPGIARAVRRAGRG